MIVSLLIFYFFYNFLCGICFGKFIGNKGFIKLSKIFIILNLLIIIINIIQFIKYEQTTQTLLFSILEIGNFNLNINLIIDSLTIFMVIVVGLISIVVHIYSINYLNGDPHIIRFISYLSLFTLFILILISSRNMLQLFIG